MSNPQNPDEYPTLPAQPVDAGGLPSQMPPVVPPQAPRKNRKPLFITCGVILVIAILACGAVGFYAYTQVQAALQPVNAAQAFCSDLKKQDYTAAYGMLSTNYQSQLSQADFTAGSKAHDQIDGTVKSCTQAGSGTSGFKYVPGKQATLAVTVTRSKPFSGNIVLVDQSGTWKIDSIDQAVQGTDLGPLIVAQSYCTAVVNADYSTAWNDLTPAFQASNFGDSLQQFTDGFTKIKSSGVTLVGCQPDFSSYSVTGSTASLNSALNVTLGSLSQAVNLAVSFQKDASGNWKISNIATK